MLMDIAMGILRIIISLRRVICIRNRSPSLV
jgi:hypothetical protein